MIKAWDHQNLASLNLKKLLCTRSIFRTCKKYYWGLKIQLTVDPLGLKGLRNIYTLTKYHACMLERRKCLKENISLYIGKKGRNMVFLIPSLSQIVSNYKQLLFKL